MKISDHTENQIYSRNMNIDYIMSICNLNWKDISWAYHNNIIKEPILFEFVDFYLLKSDEIDSSKYFEMANEIFFSNKTRSSMEILMEKHVSINELEENACKKKWLYIFLSWAYSQKGLIEDPLSAVGLIVSDFEYPEEVFDLQYYYMPPSDDYDPSLHIIDQNKYIILDKWERYISDSREKYQK